MNEFIDEKTKQNWVLNIKKYLEKGHMQIGYYQAEPSDEMPSCEREEEFVKILRSVLPTFGLRIKYVLERFPGIYVLFKDTASNDCCK